MHTLGPDDGVYTLYTHALHNREKYHVILPIFYTMYLYDNNSIHFIIIIIIWERNENYPVTVYTDLDSLNPRTRWYLA